MEITIYTDSWMINEGKAKVIEGACGQSLEAIDEYVLNEKEVEWQSGHWTLFTQELVCDCLQTRSHSPR